MTRLYNDLISRKALLEELNSLETIGCSGEYLINSKVKEAITNAPTIEADSGEAVAYRVIGKFGNNCTFKSSEIKKGDMIYTSPLKREWKSLSDEQIQDIFKVCKNDSVKSKVATNLILNFASAYQAKLKEVNGYD